MSRLAKSHDWPKCNGWPKSKILTKKFPFGLNRTRSHRIFLSRHRIELLIIIFSCLNTLSQWPVVVRRSPLWFENISPRSQASRVAEDRRWGRVSQSGKSRAVSSFGTFCSDATPQTAAKPSRSSTDKKIRERSERQRKKKKMRYTRQGRGDTDDRSSLISLHVSQSTCFKVKINSS